MANGHFESLVRRAGLDFAPVGTAEEYQAMALRPELWHPSKGLKLVLEGTVQGIRPVYEHIVARHVPGETVVHFF